VNRACVVLLTAHLEGFVEDLVDDIVDVLDQTGPATANLPRILLATQVTDEVRVIAAMEDPHRRADRIRDLFTTHAGLWLDASLAQGRLESQTVTDNLGNPGAKEITRVLALVGMANVFAEIQLPDGADPEKRVNELVGIRNVIAHGGSPAIADSRPADYIASVSAIGSGLEQAAALHLQAVCRFPTLPWQ
jgi:hypothetical protein